MSTKIIKIVLAFVIAAIVLYIYPFVKRSMLDGTEIVNEYYIAENGEVVEI